MMSGRASDPSCSCAPKTNQSRDLLRNSPFQGFSQVTETFMGILYYMLMETLNGREFNRYLNKVNTTFMAHIKYIQYSANKFFQDVSRLLGPGLPY